MTGYTSCFIWPLYFNCVEVSFYVLILKSSLAIFFSWEKLKILRIIGKIDTKLIKVLWKRCLGKWSRKKCNVLHLKTFPQTSVLHKTPKKRKDEGIGQRHMLLPKCKFKSHSSFKDHFHLFPFKFMKGIC